jgi:hypothetical protein
MQFTVGLKLNGKADHVVLDEQDALAAALKVKAEFPEAVIMYVRPQNRRGDSRHPSHGFGGDVLRRERPAEPG